MHCFKLLPYRTWHLEAGTCHIEVLRVLQCSALPSNFFFKNNILNYFHSVGRVRTKFDMNISNSSPSNQASCQCCQHTFIPTDPFDSALLYQPETSFTVIRTLLIGPLFMSFISSQDYIEKKYAHIYTKFAFIFF